MQNKRLCRQRFPSPSSIPVDDGYRQSLATGGRQSLATGGRQFLATGNRQTLTTGDRQSLATGDRQSLATAIIGAILLEEYSGSRRCAYISGFPCEPYITHLTSY
ncbi:hypothetical protein Y032_0056g2700 [Ancylostoma ceylanicum]|uniref:Uncharacterized protein n=1 Tax=Ancylostoma ceylanicum TaxID=53326 RepID=A0A016U6W4_9BILA|nr:hypothetical protein Y032_0056g2700 [Ancylostoma ceylanicum]